LALGGAIFAAMGAGAYAGYIQPAPVDVDLVAGFAGGDQLTARLDPDDDVFIGCGSRTISDGAGGVFRTGFCQAEDDAGDNVTCFTQDPLLLDEIRAASAFAYITFSFTGDDTIGYTCTRIGFSTQSFYLYDYGKIKTKKK